MCIRDSDYPAAACREDGLEAVEHLRIAEQLPELPAGALGVGFVVVHPDVEDVYKRLTILITLVLSVLGSLLVSARLASPVNRLYLSLIHI